MEPVSLAFGVVGVASNIIDTSFKIRDQVAAYKSAAADIQNINNKIDLVVGICEILKTDNNLPVARHDTRDRALATCYASVLNIHQELGSLTTRGKSRRQKLDWLLKKPAIEKSVQELNESTSLLNMCIAAEVLNRFTLQTKATSSVLPSASEAVTRVELPARRWDESPHSTKTTRPIVTKSETTAYKNALYIYKSTETCQKDDEYTGETESRSYLFGIPILDTYIHFAMKRGPLSPWRLTLNTPRFIYEEQNKALYDEILSYGRWWAPSHEVARWLEKHGVSANTQLVSRRVNSLAGCQMSLLGAMVVYRRKNVVDCLLSSSGQNLGDESHLSGCRGYVPRSTFSKGHEGFSDDPVLAYVKMRGPLLTFEEYCEFAKFGDNPQYIELLFDSCRELLYEDQARVLKFTAYAVLRIFLIWGYRRTSLDVECSPLISKLISLGLDVTETLCPDDEPATGRTQYSSQPRALRHKSGTALHMALEQWWRPIYETVNIAQEWVSCLEKASVPIDQYFEAERVTEMERTGRDSTAQELDEWNRMSRTEKLEFLYDLVNPGVRAAQETEAPDDLLKTVMPSFQYMQTMPISAISPEEATTHLAWKRNHKKVNTRSWYFISWPFLNDTYTPLLADRKLKNLDEGTLKMLSAYDYYISLYNSRAERRQSKKWRKLQRRVGTAREQSMPGAWKMEWWEYQGPW